MISLQELCQHLDTLLESALFKDYCENGLQVEGSPTISSVATAVSASESTIAAAIEQGVDALIVHHGLFWNRDSYAVTGVKKRKLDLLLKHNLSLIAYHLPLDAHRTLGNNWKAAELMGWTELEPFGKFGEQAIGVKGKVAMQDRVIFTQTLEAFYGQSARTALFGKKEVTTAALISGGAYRSLIDAAKERIDCFITGNFDEPAWFDAEEYKINFFAMGHSATEKIGPKSLGKYVEETFSLPTKFIDIHNPF